MTDDEAKELTHHIYKIEKGRGLPLTFKVVYPDETGTYKCYGTFYNTIS